MDAALSFLFAHAQYAHWVIVGLLILAACSIPISEDFVVICGGVLASTVIPENTLKLYFAILLGAYFSDFIPYTVGRLFGHNLWKIGWFSRLVPERRLEQIKTYYARYGVWTILIGRFIPFGVRNCVFLSSGIAKVPFLKFAISDAIACLLSITTIFTLAYSFGKNYHLLTAHLKMVSLIVFALFITILITWFWIRRRKAARKEMIPRE